MKLVSHAENAVTITYTAARPYLSVTPDWTGRLEIGLDRSHPLDSIAWMEVFAKTAKAAADLSLPGCRLELDGPAAQLGDRLPYLLLMGLSGAAYRFHKYQTNAQDAAKIPMVLSLTGRDEAFDRALDRAGNLVRAVLLARDLVNEPGNHLTPDLLARRLTDAFTGLPVEVTVLDPAALETLGAGALLAVGNSSVNGPRLIALTYTGAPEDSRRLGLVGKGVTVDTGGYCLKTPAGLLGTKGDMAGAAAVSCALLALAQNGVRANVTAVIPACENRLSDGSMIPGDVITSLSGKTIEVGNTDAEGRLILADALTYAIREAKATHLVDIATLTGAVCAMFGSSRAGAMTSDESFFAQLLAAAEPMGERYWLLPGDLEYDKLVDSAVADVKNRPGSCGTIAAGLFLRRFTEDKPWIHLDVAGTAWTSPPIWAYQTEGATGAGTATLYRLAETFFQK